jgi:hypothetical protein
VLILDSHELTLASSVHTKNQKKEECLSQSFFDLYNYDVSTNQHLTTSTTTIGGPQLLKECFFLEFEENECPTFWSGFPTDSQDNGTLFRRFLCSFPQEKERLFRIA